VVIGDTEFAEQVLNRRERLSRSVAIR
jgi:hypothetical protein